MASFPFFSSEERGDRLDRSLGRVWGRGGLDVGALRRGGVILGDSARMG